METIKRNFIKNPSKKNLILFTLLWFLGITLLILSTTDLFIENFLQKRYIMIYFLMIGSTIATVKLYMNYWRNKNLSSNSNSEWITVRDLTKIWVSGKRNWTQNHVWLPLYRKNNNLNLSKFLELKTTQFSQIQKDINWKLKKALKLYLWKIIPPYLRTPNWIKQFLSQVYLSAHFGYWDKCLMFIITLWLVQFLKSCGSPVLFQ